MRFSHKIVALATIAAILALDSSLTSAQIMMPPEQPTLTDIKYKQKHRSMAKASSDLVALWAEHQAYSREADPRTFQSKNSLLPVYDGRVVVDAVAAGNTDTLLADLQKLGLQRASTYGSFVSGLLPIESTDETAQLTSLQFVRPAYRRASNSNVRFLR